MLVAICSTLRLLLLLCMLSIQWRFCCFCFFYFCFFLIFSFCFVKVFFWFFCSCSLNVGLFAYFCFWILLTLLFLLYSSLSISPSMGFIVMLPASAIQFSIKYVNLYRISCCCLLGLSTACAAAFYLAQPLLIDNI